MRPQLLPKDQRQPHRMAIRLDLLQEIRWHLCWLALNVVWKLELICGRRGGLLVWSAVNGKSRNREAANQRFGLVMVKNPAVPTV